MALYKSIIIIIIIIIVITQEHKDILVQY